MSATIPVVDLSALDGGPMGRGAVADAVQSAYGEVGFAYLTGERDQAESECVVHDDAR